VLAVNFPILTVLVEVLGSLLLMQGVLCVASPRLFRSMLRFYPKVWSDGVKSVADRDLRLIGGGTTFVSSTFTGSLIDRIFDLQVRTLDMWIWIISLVSASACIGLIAKPRHTTRMMGWEDAALRLGGDDERINAKLRFIGMACVLGLIYLAYSTLR
jgi:hypothetical protein